MFSIGGKKPPFPSPPLQAYSFLCTLHFKKNLIFKVIVIRALDVFRSYFFTTVLILAGIL